MLMTGDMKYFLFEVCAWCTDTCLPPHRKQKQKQNTGSGSWKWSCATNKVLTHKNDCASFNMCFILLYECKFCM